MIIVDSRFCPQNHPCPVIGACPVGAITQEGYGLPVVDDEMCADCGKCMKLCPSFREE